MYNLQEVGFANLNTHFSLDFEQQNKFNKKQSISRYFSSTCGQNMNPYD